MPASVIYNICSETGFEPLYNKFQTQRSLKCYKNQKLELKKNDKPGINFLSFSLKMYLYISLN